MTWASFIFLNSTFFVDKATNSDLKKTHWMWKSFYQIWASGRSSLWLHSCCLKIKARNPSGSTQSRSIFFEDTSQGHWLQQLFEIIFDCSFRSSSTQEEEIFIVAPSYIDSLASDSVVNSVHFHDTGRNLVFLRPPHTGKCLPFRI